MRRKVTLTQLRKRAENRHRNIEFMDRQRVKQGKNNLRIELDRLESLMWGRLNPHLRDRMGSHIRVFKSILN